jgi:hypothetical protein
MTLLMTYLLFALDIESSDMRAGHTIAAQEREYFHWVNNGQGRGSTKTSSLAPIRKANASPRLSQRRGIIVLWH